MLGRSRGKREVPSPDATSSETIICNWLVALGIVAYVVLFSARTISAYTSGTSLFDLATYAQGFWNALGNPPFFYSLEGETSRFARHFSPFFYLLLPFYWLRPDPTTLLATQALALGLGALPIYWLASRRLNKSVAAIFALAYLFNPAVHDVNIQNDFHEIAFALPLLLLAFFLAIYGRPILYGAALLLALSTREEIGLTTAAFGIYLGIGEGRRRRGVVTVAASLIWLIVVVEWVMPSLNVSGHFPMADGYSYLGNSPITILEGVLAHPLLALQEITRPPKLDYLLWLLEPVAFLPILAPEAVVVAGPALLEVLLSTNPVHYRIFERYAAPIVPVVFFAAIVGSARAWRGLQAFRWPRDPARRAFSGALGLAVIVATVVCQLVLRKLPTEIQFSPDPHSAIALRIAASLPGRASVISEDHRLLPHLADRRFLYSLSSTSPKADYVLFDRKRSPITNVPSTELRAAEGRYLGDPDYLTLQCEDGIYLLGLQEAASRDGSIAFPSGPSAPDIADFGHMITLNKMEVDQTQARPGGTLVVTLTWRTMRRVDSDYQVFVQLIDGAGQLRGQHDGGPQDQLCLTSTWTPGLVVRDQHDVPLPLDLSPGRYELRVGLYSLASLKRIAVTSNSPNSHVDYVSMPIDVLR